MLLLIQCHFLIVNWLLFLPYPQFTRNLFRFIFGFYLVRLMFANNVLCLVLVSGGWCLVGRLIEWALTRERQSASTINLIWSSRPVTEWDVAKKKDKWNRKIERIKGRKEVFVDEFQLLNDVIASILAKPERCRYISNASTFIWSPS